MHLDLMIKSTPAAATIDAASNNRIQDDDATRDREGTDQSTQEKNC